MNNKKIDLDSVMELLQIIQIAGDAILSINEKFLIIRFNTGAEKIFGYTSEEIVGQSLSVLIPEKFNKKHEIHLTRFIDSQQVSKRMGIHQHQEVYGLRKNGDEFPMESTISKLVTSRGIILTTIIRDISEQKNKEKRLELQSYAISSLVKNEFSKNQSIGKSLNLISKIASRALNVQSSSLWLFKEDFTTLEYQQIYQSNPKKLDTRIIKIFKSDYPKLFEEAFKGEIVEIADALTDPRIEGKFTEKYLLSAQTHAILGIPLYKNGEIIGIFSFEHSGGIRNWFPDEVSFAKTISAFILLSLENLKRERVEFDLNQSRNELAVFFQTANLPIFGINVKGEINEWNKSAEKITGFTKEEVLGKEFIGTLINKADKEYVKSLIFKTLVQNVENISLPIRSKLGSTIEILINSTIRRNYFGKIVGVVGVGQNITELKKIRLEQARIAEELISLIDTANAPIFGIDDSGKVNEWNQTSEKITGFSKAEVIGRNLIDDFINDDYKKSVKKILDKSLSGQETANFEFSLLTKNNNKVMVLLSSTSRRNSDGEIIGVVGVGQDVTEISKYRENLEKLVKNRTSELNKSLNEIELARDLISAILKSVADGLIVTDSDKRILLMNMAAESLLGTTLDAVYNQPIQSVIKNKDLKNQVKDIFHKKNIGLEIDFTFTNLDNKQKTFRTCTASIIDKEGKDRGIVALFHDVTDEREVDRLKTEFISTAAHELRTPLTSIKGFSEILITRTNLSQKERNKFLGFINKQAKNLASIVNDLLDISRIESGLAMNFDKNPFIIQNTINETISRVEGMANDYSFVTKLPEENVLINGDEEKISQVLMNLLSNAIKYSPDEKEVLIQGAVSNKKFSFSVVDHGIGMSPKQANMIFSKFYRVNASHSAPEGTGLGMTIVKYIVEAHNGSISISSKLSKGTKVTITIPI